MSLNPNNDLLNFHFETYRLSLKELKSVTKDICCELYDWNFNNNTENFSKVKAFGTHNNIILDEFFPNNAYFVTKDITIYRISFFEEIFNVSDVKIVFQSAISVKDTPKRSPPVLFFPSSNISCLYDGIKSLSVLYTDNRSVSNMEHSCDTWELLCSTEINVWNCDVTLLECRVEAMVTDKNSSNLPLDGEILHCCFMKLLDLSFEKNVELIWRKYKYCHQSSQLLVIEEKIWRGDAPPEMVTFSSDFNSMEVIGDHSFRHIPQGIDISTLTSDNIKSVASWWENSSDFLTVQYYLNVSADDFTINILYPDNEDEDVVISLVVKDKEPLELERRKLDCTVDKELSKWFFEKEMLTVKFKKIEMESMVVEESKVTFDQNEEIDNCEDSDMAIVSFDGGSGEIVEEIDMSRNSWLFKTRLTAGGPLCPCLRHNVDGLVWCKARTGSPWTHSHTLNAFGYVSAAKEDRKYLACSLPTRSDNGCQFAVISDWRRYLCVLMQGRPLDPDMAVKNRASGLVVRDTADEMFVSLDQCQDIVGLAASSWATVVLYRTVDGRLKVTVVQCL